MNGGQRNLVLVAAHFTPSNLAGVHRARLWATHLKEFGWNPIVVTTHHDYYEEKHDWDLHALVDPSLEVIRTRALPIKPIRVVGDIGIRALLPHYNALRKLASQRRIDLLHVTIPSHFSGVLGRMLYESHHVPYGIDYIDPWVHDFPGSDVPFTKAWGSARLADVLEPWAVRHASLITGVARGYFEAVLDRNPHLRDTAVTAAMPYGISERDYSLESAGSRRTHLFDSNDGMLHMMYAGAILPKAHVLLDALMQGLALLKAREPHVLQRLRMHFIGTGSSPTDAQSFVVRPYIERYGLSEYVDEHPLRVPYLDVLHHLQQTSANLILGSTESHYTPSKAFQVVRAGRPVFALLHEASTAASMLSRANAGTLVTLTETRIPSAEELAAAFSSFLRAVPSWSTPVDFSMFEEVTARHSARVLAEAADAALALPRNRRGA